MIADVLFRLFKKIFGQIEYSGPFLDPNLPCTGSFEAVPPPEHHQAPNSLSI